MVVHRTVRNGAIVPEESARIAEGQRVQIVVLDHYIYGAPKREPQQ